MSNYRCPDCGKEGLNASTFLFHDGCKSADQKPAAGPRVWLINSLDEGDDGPAVFIHGPDAHMVEVVEKSYADRMERELAFVKTQWKQTSDLLEQERNRLTAELADVRKERDKEQRQANVLAIALSTYRNHQFCECGVEGCGDCAEDCSVRAYVDGELLAYQAWRSGEG